MKKNEIVIHPLKTGYLTNRKNHGKEGEVYPVTGRLFVLY
jgi:hypothetical protein